MMVAAEPLTPTRRRSYAPAASIAAFLAFCLGVSIGATWLQTGSRSSITRRSLAVRSMRQPLQHDSGEADAPDADCSHISRLVVLGERHSGTNLLEQLLRRNVNLTVQSRLTSHKHFMQPKPKHSVCNTLVVLGVRNAYDWAYRMERECFCCFTHGKLQSGMAFNNFLTMRYVPVTEPFPIDQCHTDVDINTNRTFVNIIAMRAIKYKHWLGLKNEMGLAGLELVRWEDMQEPAEQTRWLEQLIQKYGLPVLRPDGGGAGNGTAQLVAVEEDARKWVKLRTTPKQRKERSMYFNPKRWPSSIGPEDINLITSMLDARLEASMGYQPLTLDA